MSVFLIRLSRSCELTLCSNAVKAFECHLSLWIKSRILCIYFSGSMSKLCNAPLFQLMSCPAIASASASPLPKAKCLYVKIFKLHVPISVSVQSPNSISLSGNAEYVLVNIRRRYVVRQCSLMLSLTTLCQRKSNECVGRYHHIVPL